MGSLCVFCGSGLGARPIFREAAETLGEQLARRGIRLIYGGAAVGLMGTLADAVLAQGGEVIGIIPKGLFAREVPHRGVTQLLEVDNMHVRKQQMYQLADAFLVLPGGLGTLDELFEIWTWSQLGLHTKPIGILNLEGCYAHLLAHLQQIVADGFVKADTFAQLHVGTTVDSLLEKLQR